MFTRKFIFAVIGLAAAPLIAIVAWQTEQGWFGGSESSQEASVDQGRTIGDRRRAILRKLTSEYIASNPNVDLAISSGKRLAPAPYLNRRLEKNGAAWRVRSIDGLDAETYLVS